MAAVHPKPIKLSRAVIYENPWVNLYVDKVEFPDGRIIEKHHFLDFERQAVVALTENAVGEILFVQAYRYTTDSINWELPAGGIERAEPIIEAARREVREESGFETENHRQIYSFNSLSGISNHVAHVVYCQAAHDTGQFDKNEIAAVKWFSKAEIYQMLKDNVIKDGITLVALLFYLNGLIYEKQVDTT